MQPYSKTKLAVTIGDPAGIGPEIVLKSLLSDEVAGICRPLIIGSESVLLEAAEKMGLAFVPADHNILNAGEIKDRNFPKSRASLAGGRDCAAYIKKAAELAMLKVVDAIVTAPISKEALKMAGLAWPGHTEMLAELTGTKDYAMLLCGGPLRVILTTIHTALRNVPGLVTRDKVLQTIMLAKRACEMMGINGPRIAVAGLNPHAGESGIFGDEEIGQIAPAIEEAREMGIPVTGPYPPDALFHKAYKGDFDIVVCMYHDQGLIPLKMVAFEKGVNMTVGLPFVRTSPDHGTAYDIAWKGIADPSSMIEAIKLAAGLGGNAK
ncbi:MAG TPA: 4-hydroxythreonine-4-phosphate dehydrogenase PdxA [Dissulfurispiraceae bacterium]|nr:4-hydroxythreonine-4-phosphate dehydrogenase PdxA [Dissulfurispiraceae bacterium]